jgi:hypothetical protein
MKKREQLKEIATILMSVTHTKKHIKPIEDRYAERARFFCIARALLKLVLVAAVVIYIVVSVIHWC